VAEYYFQRLFRKENTLSVTKPARTYTCEPLVAVHTGVLHVFK